MNGNNPKNTKSSYKYFDSHKTLQCSVICLPPTGSTDWCCFTDWLLSMAGNDSASWHSWRESSVIFLPDSMPERSWTSISNRFTSLLTATLFYYFSHSLSSVSFCREKEPFVIKGMLFFKEVPCAT